MSPGTTLRLLLGDQLNPRHTWFEQRRDDVLYVFMEMREETDYVLHHAQLWQTIVSAGVNSFGEASAAQLAWPLNRAEALQQLDAFVEKALPHFGDFQDADEPSRLANVSLAPVF